MLIIIIYFTFSKRTIEGGVARFLSKQFKDECVNHAIDKELLRKGQEMSFTEITSLLMVLTFVGTIYVKVSSRIDE